MSSPNVVKITIMLEELGLTYRQHHVNVFAGEQYEAEFLKISPNNKVPVIVDADGPEERPLAVFESGAILIYLAEKSGSAPARARRARRASVLEWLMLQLTGVGPMFGQLVHFTRYAPAGHEYSLQRYTSEVRRLLGVLEQRLVAECLSRRRGILGRRCCHLALDPHREHDLPLAGRGRARPGMRCASGPPLTAGSAASAARPAVDARRRKRRALS